MSIVLFVIVNGLFAANFLLRRDRRFVNRWTKPLVATDALLLLAAVGTPVAVMAIKLAAKGVGLVVTSTTGLLPREVAARYGTSAGGFGGSLSVIGGSLPAIDALNAGKSFVDERGKRRLRGGQVRLDLAEHRHRRVGRPVVGPAGHVPGAAADLAVQPHQVDVDARMLDVPLVVAVQVGLRQQLQLHVERLLVEFLKRLLDRRRDGIGLHVVLDLLPDDLDRVDDYAGRVDVVANACLRPGGGLQVGHARRDLRDPS